MFIPEPDANNLQKLLKDTNRTKDTIKELCPPEVQAALIEIGALTPTTTFYERNKETGKIILNDKNGYRTALPLHLQIALPRSSLIHLDNMSCICPDPCHMSTRIVEKDIKLIAEGLLTRGRLDNFKQFEFNCHGRDTKHQQMKLIIKAGPGSNGKEIEEVSLGGKDARLLIAPPDSLPGTNFCPLFEGVFYHDRKVPFHRLRSIEILAELEVLTPQDYVADTTSQVQIPSERAIGDLLFYSHYMIMK